MSLSHLIGDSIPFKVAYLTSFNLFSMDKLGRTLKRFNLNILHSMFFLVPTEVFNPSGIPDIRSHLPTDSGGGGGGPVPRDQRGGGR